MLSTMARDFLSSECTETLVREMETDLRGYPETLWGKMAGLGWLGLVIPEEYGGAGLEFMDLATLLEEMGRFLVPGPFIPSSVCCGLAILNYGTEAQKQHFLADIAKGQTTVALAFHKPMEFISESRIDEIITSDDEGFTISGTRLFVPYGNSADWFLYKAETKAGIRLLLIDSSSTGVSCSVISTIGADKQTEINLDMVRVPAENELGNKSQSSEIVDRINEWGALSQSAYILGSLAMVLDMSVEYSKQRVQFNKPIGTFQAIQHLCAEMSRSIEGLKLLVLEAAWKLDQGEPSTLQVSMAKARASDAARSVTIAGHKVHGGVGVITDHKMPLYFKKAKSMELAFGDGDLNREIIAYQMQL